MLKLSAQVATNEGETVISFKQTGPSVANLLDSAKEQLMEEFDHCFEADKWQTISIQIERGREEV